MAETHHVDDIDKDPTDGAAGEVPAQVVAPADKAAETPAEAVARERVEAWATRSGWKPDGKLDAVEFMETVPDYREGLTGKLREHEATVRKLYKVIGEKMVSDQARERASAERELEEAAEAGDVPRVKRAAEVLAKPAETLDDLGEPADAEAAAQAKIKVWTEQPAQAWFQTDKNMAQDAASLYDAEVKKNGGVNDPDKILPIVTAKIRKLHSEKFTNPNREQASGGTRTGNGRVTQQSSTSEVASKVDPIIYKQYKDWGLTDAQVLKAWESQKNG